jgi:hypothetical protein
MTHANNFSIPVRFNFRPFEAEWQVCIAHTLGWVEEWKPTPGFPAIRAPILRPIANSLIPNGDRVRVSIAIPNESGIPSVIYGLGHSNCYEVEMYRQDLPPEVLPKYETKDNSPDISDRTFAVLLCQKDEFRGLFPTSKPKGTTKSAWVMRDEFLHMPHEIWDLRRFLNRWGLWSTVHGYSPSNLDFLVVHPHQVWRLQDTYRRALTGSAKAWLRSSRSLYLIPTETAPYFSIEVSDCDAAIKATITINHLTESTFGICKRNDCRKLFEFTSKQRRLYCTPHCAHVANVREQRAKQKKATSQKGRIHAES